MTAYAVPNETMCQVLSANTFLFCEYLCWLHRHDKGLQKKKKKEEEEEEEEEKEVEIGERRKKSRLT